MAVINWGSFMGNVMMVEGEKQFLHARTGRGKSNFMLEETIRKSLHKALDNLGEQEKQEQGINVEVVNDIPQEDLDYIVNLYEHGNLGGLDFLGKGEYGYVYGYKNYAIKKIYDTDPHGSADARVLKDISHLDSVVTLYAVIDNYTLITERIEGRTLRNYMEISTDNPLNLGEDTLEQFNEALMDIIQLGYTPWDMHGDNIMVDKDGNIKIVDVGFFKKHGVDFDRFGEDKHTYITSDRGYSQAQNLAGSELRNYIKRMKMREERMKQELETKFMAV